jgi:hypothetical protein
MLLGRQYELDTATLAVNTNRVAEKIPAGSLVRVISEVKTNDRIGNDRMVDVLWEGRPYTLFVTDLIERGKTVNEPNDSAIPDSMPDAEGLSQALREDLKSAHERRQRAYDLFHEVMTDIPSGLPHPDGTDRIRQASRQLDYAEKDLIEALGRLDKFLTGGPIAAGTQRKPVDSQTGRDLSKKSGVS